MCQAYLVLVQELLWSRVRVSLFVCLSSIDRVQWNRCWFFFRLFWCEDTPPVRMKWTFEAFCFHNSSLLFVGLESLERKRKGWLGRTCGDFMGSYPVPFSTIHILAESLFLGTNARRRSIFFHNYPIHLCQLSDHACGWSYESGFYWRRTGRSEPVKNTITPAGCFIMISACLSVAYWLFQHKSHVRKLCL